MEKKSSKTRISVGGLLLLGALGLLFPYGLANSRPAAGVLITSTASAQPDTVATPLPSLPADPIYMKIEGIDGESADREHKDWIELLSFSQGQYLSLSSGAAGGAGLGRLVFEEFTVKKTLDKASPKLAEACCKGTVVPTVQLHLARPLTGGTQATYCTYELKNVIVTSYHISGSTQDAVPTESLSLNFEEIRVAYTEYDAAGRAKGTVQYGWDLKQNKGL